jgi:diguanylate cyclase (GGDEF)-like protein
MYTGVGEKSINLLSDWSLVELYIDIGISRTYAPGTVRTSMADRISRSGLLLSLALACFAINFLCSIVLIRAPIADTTSSILQLMLEVVFLTICFYRYHASLTLRHQWRLLSTSLLLRTCVYLLSAIDGFRGFLPRLTDWSLSFTDLISFFVLIPFLLLMSLPSGQEYPRIFFWIDAIQAVFVGYLGYVKLFGIIPFTHGRVQPLSAADITLFYARIALFYNIVCIVLSIAATLRFFASTDEDEARFYRIQAICIWASTLLTMLKNWVPERSLGWADALSVSPVVLSCWLILRLPAESGHMVAKHRHHFLTRILNHTSPAFFSIALVLLGLDAARKYFFLGAGAALTALLLYCIRAAILQSRYEESEHSLQRARDQLEELSLQDALTGVANRRCFDRTLRLEWSRMGREETTLSLLLIDIDYFKNLNDRHGHLYGDECLTRVAAALASVVTRSGDLLARYGGEEFAVILPGTDESGARLIAERLQAAVNQLRISHHTPIGDSVSISVGIATHGSLQNGSETLLIEASDRALYQAKERGRNRIEFSHVLSHG